MVNFNVAFSLGARRQAKYSRQPGFKKLYWMFSLHTFFQIKDTNIVPSALVHYIIHAISHLLDFLFCYGEPGLQVGHHVLHMRDTCGTR